uniref:USP domain-containing protein n=1 Tax=Zonotrichia albicollis TaxID=44394 RepID=A0A8D2NGF6_ZONAL
WVSPSKAADSSGTSANAPQPTGAGRVESQQMQSTVWLSSPFQTTILSYLIKYNFPAAAGIAEGMALPQRILFPPQEICMDWQQRQRPGAGLCNLGSTCYINVILQCLTYTPPLANYLLSRDHSQLCHQQGFCMMCIMEAHVRKVLRSSANVIWPRAVPDMAGDAYEFLRCALEAMQRACLSGSSE